jgi:hypothetical protein
MTLADVRRLLAHWRRYPPLRDLVAGAIGFRPAPPRPAAPAHEAGELLVAMFPDGRMRL